MKSVFLILLTLFSNLADATERSSAQRAAFVKANPCPTTGKARGACPGYVVDHVEPLCAGGADHPANMQWQTVEDAKEKDKDEWRTCRAIRRANHGR